MVQLHIQLKNKEIKFWELYNWSFSLRVQGEKVALGTGTGTGRGLVTYSGT